MLNRKLPNQEIKKVMLASLKSAQELNYQVEYFDEVNGVIKTSVPAALSIINRDITLRVEPDKQNQLNVEASSEFRKNHFLGKFLSHHAEERFLKKLKKKLASG